MVKYRDHRGTLYDSMKTVRDVSSVTELTKHIQSQLDFPIREVTVKPYGYDFRNNWDSYIVCVDGAAVGFTDGPLC